MARVIPQQLKDTKFGYQPIHTDALVQAVSHALDNKTSGVYSLNGSETLTLKQMVAHLAEQQGSDVANVKHSNTFFGFADLFNEFWSGVSHDSNMAKMAEHFGANGGLQEPDYFKEHGLDLEGQSFKDFYNKNQAPMAQDLASPLFIDYKRISLD